MSPAEHTEWLPATQSRSRGVLLTIALVIGVETVALHLWLRQHHAYLAWTLTSLSLLTLAWLIRDHRALSDAGLRLSAEGCDVHIGRRARAYIPWTAVENVRVPSWRDLPQPTREYLNAARPEDPNLVFSFRDALGVKSVLGERQVRQLGLRVADAHRVVQGWQQSHGSAIGGSAIGGGR